MICAIHDMADTFLEFAKMAHYTKKVGSASSVDLIYFKLPTYSTYPVPMDCGQRICRFCGCLCDFPPVFLPILRHLVPHCDLDLQWIVHFTSSRAIRFLPSHSPSPAHLLVQDNRTNGLLEHQESVIPTSSALIAVGLRCADQGRSWEGHALRWRGRGSAWSWERR